MRIGIDIRALGGASGRRGVGTYIRGLLGGLAREIEGADHQIILFTSRPLEQPAGNGFTQVSLRRPARGITLWDQVAWPPLISRRKLAIFHSPFYAIPRIRSRRCRVVQTIHDLTPLKFPGAVSRHNARIFRVNFSLARSADRIIVPSRATRDDVESLLEIPRERITVIEEATDVTAGEVEAAGARLPELLGRLRISGSYLLHTGGHDIVKNLPGTLEAFAEIAARRDIRLVIVGEHGTGTASAIQRAAMRGLLDRVILPGYVPRPDLIALYRGAAALVYPSFAEGFGLPVLEAMACGTPVVTARAGALPEVGGDACLYADPSRPETIAAAIESILDDPARAADLSRQGRERAARFTWREAARRTLSVYEDAAA